MMTQPGHFWQIKGICSLSLFTPIQFFFLTWLGVFVFKKKKMSLTASVSEEFGALVRKARDLDMQYDVAKWNAFTQEVIGVCEEFDSAQHLIERGITGYESNLEDDSLLKFISKEKNQMNDFFEEFDLQLEDAQETFIVKFTKMAKEILGFKEHKPPNSVKNMTIFDGKIYYEKPVSASSSSSSSASSSSSSSSIPIAPQKATLAAPEEEEPARLKRRRHVLF